MSQDILNITFQLLNCAIFSVYQTQIDKCPCATQTQTRMSSIVHNETKEKTEQKDYKVI